MNEKILRYIFINTIYMLINEKIINDLLIPIISIPSIDILLCYLFGKNSRWFQLHSVINSVIVYTIYPEIYELIMNPIENNRITVSNIDTNYIICLHIYHMIAFNNITNMDRFHHILFVGLGLIPCRLYFNNIIIKFVSFSMCGLTGSIEYFMLSLVKHNKITAIRQKKINSYIYNYIRYPLTLYTVFITYICYINNPRITEYPYFLLYCSSLIFFNGSYYNKITTENYIEHNIRLLGVNDKHII